MDLGYPSKTVMHYILVGRMTCFGCQDGFPMVSVLVHVMHKIGRASCRERV